jgi:hypothetical protein
MGFFGDVWRGVKNFASSMNPVQRAKDFMNDPFGSMASTMTGGAGMLVNAISGSSDAKTWEETPWYDRLATSIKAKGQSLINTPLEWLGLEDYTNTSAQDRINTLKYKEADNAVGNFDAGLAIALGQEKQRQEVPQEGVAAGDQGSLGRAIALENDPVLQQPVDNFNNFSF